MPTASTSAARPLTISPSGLVYAGLVVLTLAVYGQLAVGGFEFIDLDDPEYVQLNGRVQQGFSLEGVRWAFTTRWASNWHPLTWLSLQLDYQLYGAEPWGFHLTNVLLHLANACLLFAVLKRMTGALWCSAAVAAFFSVHPAHVESVAWVAERKDVLSALFWLLTMYAYARYAEKPGVGRYLPVALALALGLLAKQMLVTLPAVLLLLDYWPLRRWRFAGGTSSLGRLILEKLPLVALVAAAIPMTIWAQALLVKPLDDFPLPVRIENALIVYVKYIVMMVWPIDLAIFYPHPRGGIRLWKAVAAAAALVAVTAAVVWQGRRRPYLPVGWLWYVGTLVPVIGLMQVGRQEMADRYTYLPYVGLFILLSWGVADAAARRQLPPTGLALLTGALLVACAVCAALQVRHWKNVESLWRHSLVVADTDAAPRMCLATELAKKGKFDEAETQLREILRMEPQWADARGLLASIYEQTGQLNAAAEQLEQVVRRNPGEAPARLALARIRDRQNRLDDAEQQLAEVVRRQPSLEVAHTGLGSVLERKGNLTAACEQYEAAANLIPTDPVVQCRLGVVLRRLGNWAEAAAAFDRALKLEPDRIEALSGKALALEGLRKFAEAATLYGRVVELEPTDLVQRCNLAYALASAGRDAEAVRQFAEADRLNPAWRTLALNEARAQAAGPDPARRSGTKALRTATMVCQATGYQQAQALDVLAAAYAELGKFDDAVSWQSKALDRLAYDEPESVRAGMQERLRLYESHQPYRMPAK
ncbi:MAG: tetratricopeptide repeat protein [Gemmataceae bacterium]